MRNNQQRGFTLLELLLALMLSALLLGLAFAGLRTYLNTATVVERAVDNNDRVRAVLQFVRAQLRETTPLAWRGDSQSYVVFSGDAEQVGFMGRVPSHRAPGGLFYNVIRTAKRADQLQLSFEYARLPLAQAWHDDSFAALEPIAATTLLEAVSAVRFAYFGRGEDGGEAQWQDQWSPRAWLPELVKLELDLPGGDRREVLVQIRAAFVPRRLTQVLQRGETNSLETLHDDEIDPILKLPEFGRRP